jgi:hypothetical protein
VTAFTTILGRNDEVMSEWSAIQKRYQDHLVEKSAFVHVRGADNSRGLPDNRRTRLIAVGVEHVRGLARFL